MRNTVEKLTVFSLAGKAAMAGRSRTATRPWPAMLTCLKKRKIRTIYDKIPMLAK